MGFGVGGVGGRFVTRGRRQGPLPRSLVLLIQDDPALHELGVGADQGHSLHGHGVVAVHVAEDVGFAGC